jgi:hypothetical protein
MRANITINDLGIVLVSSNAAPLTGSAVAGRLNQEVKITLGSDPTVAALLSLILTLRAVKAPIMPANERASNHRILSAARLLDDLEAPIISG